MKKKRKFSPRRFWSPLTKSISKFSEDNGVKHSASLSYYTIFALPAMLVIILSVAGFFFGRDAIQGHVYAQISGIVGNDAAAQIEETIRNIHLSGDTRIATIISVITLLVG